MRERRCRVGRNNGRRRRGLTGALGARGRRRAPRDWRALVGFRIADSRIRREWGWIRLNPRSPPPASAFPPATSTEDWGDDRTSNGRRKFAYIKTKRVSL